MEQLEVHQTESVSVGKERITSCMGDPLNQSFSPEFVQVIPKRTQPIFCCGSGEGVGDARVNLHGGESRSCSDMGKPHQGLHQGELSRRVQPQSRDALSRGIDGGSRELTQLSSVDKGLENVLLDIEIVLGNVVKLLSECGKILHGLSDAIILVDVVGGGLGSQYPFISHILLDEPFFVVASDDRVGQVEVLDGGLELTLVAFGDSAAEDDGEFVGLTNGSVGIE